MSKHTLGPWRKVYSRNTSKIKIFGDVCEHLATAHNEANASLISAAPELLAALEAVFDEWQEMPEDMYNNALAAIRKATVK